MNTGAATDLGHWKAQAFRAVFDRCDDALLIHNANCISINATLQQQSCKVPAFISGASHDQVTGLESDTAWCEAYDPATVQRKF